MKRTDLIALAERLKPMAAAPCFDGLDMAAIDAFLRQIAESKPRAYAMHRNRIVYDILTAREYEEDGLHFGQQSVPLYTLPLED